MNHSTYTPTAPFAPHEMGFFRALEPGLLRNVAQQHGIAAGPSTTDEELAERLAALNQPENRWLP